MPWRRSRLLQNTQSPQITPSLPLGQAPHAVRRPHAEPPPPASIFRFFMRLSFPMRFRDLSTHGPPPHTVSRFPHTTTRLTYFPICHGRSPIARPSPHTIHKLQKSDFHFGEISGSSSTDPQPTPSSKHPGPALPSSKPIPNRFQANNMRYSPANQTPTKFQQITHTCEVGGAVTSCAHGMHTCAYGHGHAWPCSYLYGLCAQPRQRPGTLLTRPASGLSRSTRPTRLLKCPAAASHLRRSSANQLTQIPWGAWACRRLATRRRRRSGAPRPSRPEGRRLRPRAWIPEESGQVGLDKSPQARRRIARDE